MVTLTSGTISQRVFVTSLQCCWSTMRHVVYGIRLTHSSGTMTHLRWATILQCCSGTRWQVVADLVCSEVLSNQFVSKRFPGTALASTGDALGHEGHDFHAVADVGIETARIVDFTASGAGDHVLESRRVNVRERIEITLGKTQ